MSYNQHRNMILGSKPMFSGMLNLMGHLKMHFELWPSWNVQNGCYIFENKCYKSHHGGIVTKAEVK